MTHAWAARDTYVDAVYLAERVLTVDELAAFVTRVAPGETAPVGPDESTFWGEVSPSLLRDLLGRRLMRAGRFTAALPYLVPGHRPAAVRYARAMARATVGDPIDRAAALFAASRVARTDGLEILGTSHAPDWSLYGAQYDPYGWRAWSDEPPPARTPWHTTTEDARVAASAPVPEERYHYRFIASHLAEAAADNLPTQSQAFATTLCHAARYVRHRDPDRVDALYTRYLDDGPAVSMSFGEDCPAPEIERARRFLPPPPAPRWPMAVIAAVYLLGALWLWRRSSIVGMLRRLALVLLLALTVSVPACKKKAGNAAEGQAQAAKVTIAVDDKVVTDSPMLSAMPKPLAVLAPGAPPIESWIAVEVIDQGGKVTTILAPAKNHPGLTPALSADATSLRFGLLHDGKLEQPVDNVAKVTIKTTTDAGKPIAHADHGGGMANPEAGKGGGDSGGGGNHGTGGNSGDKSVRATPTADLEIAVETAAGKSTFTGDKMVGLPELKAPSGDTETPGWNLVDVLAAAGIKEPKAVILTDEANAALRIEGDAWNPATHVLYVKLNKSGQIRFRVFKKTGDLWEISGELRGIKSIQVP